MRGWVRLLPGGSVLSADMIQVLIHQWTAPLHARVHDRAGGMQWDSEGKNVEHFILESREITLSGNEVTKTSNSMPTGTHARTRQMKLLRV